jgi:ABC-type branched-subunit amino acid transport system permease subunit
MYIKKNHLILIKIYCIEFSSFLSKFNLVLIILVLVVVVIWEISRDYWGRPLTVRFHRNAVKKNEERKIKQNRV